MMPDLSLATLRASGLPLDWMTVYAAWRDLPQWEFYSPFSVSIEEIQEFAVDALADCDPRDENALFRIADDDSVYPDDINRYLPEFAKKSGVSETDALRKWRYVFLTGLLENLSRWINRPRSPGGDYLPDTMDMGGENIYDIEYYLRHWDFPPEPPPLFGENRTETLEFFDRLRAWLGEEKAALMGVP